MLADTRQQIDNSIMVICITGGCVYQLGRAGGRVVAAGSAAVGHGGWAGGAGLRVIRVGQHWHTGDTGTVPPTLHSYSGTLPLNSDTDRHRGTGRE